MVDFERYVAEQKFLAALEVKYGVAGRMSEMGFPLEEIAEVVRLSVGRTEELIKKYEKEKSESKEE